MTLKIPLKNTDCLINAVASPQDTELLKFIAMWLSFFGATKIKSYLYILA